MPKAISFLVITFIGIVLMLLSNSCIKKDPCKNEGPFTNYIPEGSRQMIPYQNFAELTFIDSATQDTHVFVGKGWNSTYWFYSDYSKDCPVGFNNEKYYQNFYSATYPNPIAFSFEYTNPCCEYIVVSVGKSLFYLAPIRLRAPYSYDSIIVANKLYRNIEYFKNQYQPQWDTKYGCYFNKTHGVLKIELPDGTLELFDFKNP